MAPRKAAAKSKATKPATSKTKKTTKSSTTPKAASTMRASCQRTARQEEEEEEDQQPPPDDEEENEHEPNHPSIETLATAVNNLTANAAETQDAIDELKENFSSINEKLDILTAAMANEPGRTATQPPRNNGNDPLPFIQSHLPWIDQSLLSNIVTGKLDSKDLIRLLPLEDRPKGRGNTQPSSLLLDIQTGRFTATEESSTAFDKDFPDFNTALYAISVYGMIRNLYDVDKTGIDSAILL